MSKLVDFTLVSEIKKEEGQRLAVYDDANGDPIVAGSKVEGNPTIGYGRLLTSDHGITVEEAEYLLLHDVAAAQAQTHTLPAFYHLDLARKDALIDMDFNMGLDTLSQFGTFLGLLARGQYVSAADDLRHTRWYKEVGSRGERIAKVFE